MTAFAETRGIRTYAWSTRGADHAKDLDIQDNQDSAVVVHGDEYTMLAVFDACGSARGAKVGSALAAAMLQSSLDLHVPHLLEQKRRQNAANGNWKFACALGQLLRNDLLESFRSIALQVAGTDSKAFVDFVNEYLLCTMLFAMIVDDCVIVFGLGDGAYEIDGKFKLVFSPQSNAPAYLAYELLPGNQRKTLFQIFEVKPINTVTSIGVFTDGILYLVAASGWDQRLDPADTKRWLQVAAGEQNAWLQELSSDVTYSLLQERDGELVVGEAIRPAYLRDDCSVARAFLDKRPQQSSAGV